MNKTDELKRMEADMNASAELKEKWEAAIKRISEEGNAKSDGELLAKAAAELGYNITAAELERFDAEREEVSVDDLEIAAGGKGMCTTDYLCNANQHSSTEDEQGHDFICIADYHCYIALRHTDSESFPA